MSYSPDPRANGVDEPNVCGKTDEMGGMTVALPNPVPQTIHVAVLTNDLLPCFAIPNAFSVAELMAKGGAASNTCGIARANPAAERGRLIFFAHQMTFSEVLRSMLQEL